MYTLIVNPTAGSGYALKVERQLRKRLEDMHETWEVLHTERPGHATALAREAAGRPGCRGVIAVGGDGTAYEVACGLLNSGIPLGIIPAGTGNDFIKSTGIPRKPLDALEAILKGAPRPVDVGRLNDRMFLNVCGTGFDVQVLDHTLAAKRYMRGILPYLVGLLRAIFHFQPVDVSLSVDGETRRQRVLVCSIANGCYIGGGIPICPDARPDDGLLDVVLVENRPRWQIPFYLPGLLMGKIGRFRVTTHRRCREVRLASPGMRVNVDGEILQMDEAVFSILPGKLTLYW